MNGMDCDKNEDCRMNHTMNQSKDVNVEDTYQEQYNRNPIESQQPSDSDEDMITDDFVKNDNINMATQQSRKVDENESSGLRQRNVGSSSTTNSQKYENKTPQTHHPSTKGKVLLHVKQCCNCCWKLFSILIFVLTVLLPILVRLFFYFDYTSEPENVFSLENTQRLQQPDSIIDILDLFTNSQPSQIIPLDVTLEQLYSGYQYNYTVTLAQPCSACNGQGAHFHTCPVCGGQGLIRTARGMTYCNHCHGAGHVSSETCDVCHGRGIINVEQTITVDVQAGAMENASRIYRLHDGSKIAFMIHQINNPIFQRKGDDLYMTKTISLKEALLGTTLSIKTIMGEEKEVIVKPGIQPFEEIIVKGFGFKKDIHLLKEKSKQGFVMKRAFNLVKQVYSSYFRNKGDLHIIIDIQFPPRLTEPQKQIIQNLFYFVCYY